MKRILVSLAAGMTLAAAIPVAVLSAQARGRVVADATPSADTRAADEVWTRPVTMNATAMPLRQAIDAVATSANVLIQYKTFTVDAYDKRVTVHLARVPLRAALQQVLAGTGLRGVLDGNQQLVLVDERGPRDSAATRGSVSGTVINAKTNAPVSGATVTIDDARDGTTTASDGTFRLLTSTGAHVVRVRAIGYARNALRVTVTAGSPSVVTVALEPGTSVLDEVIVTGTVVATERKAIPTPITVISGADLEKRGITRIEQLFRGEVPGLLVLERGIETYSAGSLDNGGILGGLQSSRLYSRGSSKLGGGTNPVKTYVDGVEILDPSYLGTIDPKSIEKIEIVTGPQAATIYGSGAMGGVMQIFTKKGSGNDTPEVTATLKYGALQSNLSSTTAPLHNHAVSLNGGSGPGFTYSGTLSYQYSGPWQPGLFSRVYGASVGATHTRGPFTASGSVSTTAGENGTTVGGGTWFMTIGASSYMGTPLEQKLSMEGEVRPSRGTTNTQQVSTSTGQTVSLNVDYRLTSSWQHHLTVGRTQNNFALKPRAPEYNRGWDAADTLFNVMRSVGQRTTASYNTTFLSPRVAGVTSTLTVGANGSWGDQIQMSGCLASASSTTYVTCTMNNGWSKSPINVNQSIENESWGGFGSWQVGILDRLYVTLGLRGERNPTYGRQHKIDWTPTNGVTYTIEYGDLSLKLLGSYGRSTRPPNPDARLPQVYTYTYYEPSTYIGQLANPDLTPEYSRGPQGGLELYFGNLFSVTVNHYQQNVSDLIQTQVVDSFPGIYVPTGDVVSLYQTQWRNVANIRQRGWEGTGSLNVGPLSFKGTYSWNDSRVTKSIWPQTVGFLGVPTHSGNVTVGYAAGKTSVLLSTNYVGSILTYGSNATVASAIRSLARLRMYVDRRLGELEFIATEGYAKSDLAASHRITRWASLTLNVTNLGNNFSSDVSELFPSLGRQTLLGVSLRYPQR